MRIVIDVAVRGSLRSCDAVRRVDLGFRRRRTETLFRPVLADSRKRRGYGSGIRRAHPRAALSSEAIHVEPSKDQARERHSMPARDCACVRTCDRIDQFSTPPPDANVAAGYLCRSPALCYCPAR